MIKRSVKSFVGFFLLMFMSIGLTISTLHSHHNLELHNSVDFADTGHCLNADSTLCPISGHLLEGTVPQVVESQNVFIAVNIVRTFDDSAFPSRSFICVLGRSPPAIA